MQGPPQPPKKQKMCLHEPTFILCKHACMRACVHAEKAGTAAPSLSDPPLRQYQAKKQPAAVQSRCSVHLEREDSVDTAHSEAQISHHYGVCTEHSGVFIRMCRSFRYMYAALFNKKKCYINNFTQNINIPII